MFQPFLRFWLAVKRAVYMIALANVSTLLEILVGGVQAMPGRHVGAFQPFLRFWHAQRQPYEPQYDHGFVSTLLEILGLVCLVVVGF